MALSDKKITVFTGINDVPVAPTELGGCNGSFLIQQYNQLIDELILEINDLKTRVTALESNNIPF